MNMTGTPPRDDESESKTKPIDAADLLDENGRVDPAKVKSRQDTSNHGATHIDDSTCHDMRVAAADAETVAAIADGFEATADTIRRHVRGDCNCRPVADPISTSVGVAKISAATCDALRRRVADRRIRSRRRLAEEFDISSTSVNYHLRGGCTHETTEPPCEYVDGAWRPVIEKATDETDGETGGDPA